MLTLRCTERLLKRLHARPHANLAPSTTRLGDWYANVIGDVRPHLVIFMSEKTRLPIIMPAAPLASLVPRFVFTLVEVLRRLGVPERATLAELDAMGEIVSARTASRSVLGMMKEIALELDWWLEKNEPPVELAIRLADRVSLKLERLRPRIEVLSCFGVAPSEEIASRR